MTTLTPAARGIWAGHRLTADKALYNTAECLVFTGKVDPTRLATALQQVVAEAPSLSAHYRDGSDHQGERVAAGHQVVMEHHSLPGGQPTEAALRTWAERHDLERPFALATELPCRFALLRGETADALYMAAHHIALDGFGYALFWQRLAAVYAGRPGAEFADLVAPAAAQPEADADGRKFWRERLAARPQAPTFSPAAAGVGRGQRGHRWELPQALWLQLHAVATDARCTWADVCVAVIAVVARQYTGQRQQVLGLPHMNRSGPELRAPCMQMAIVPLCVDVDDGDDLARLARKIAAEKRAVRPYQHVRHETMLRDLQALTADETAVGAVPRTHVFGPVVNILPFPTRLDFGDVKADKLIVSAGPVADLALIIHYRSQKLAPELEFCGHAAGLPPAALVSLCTAFADLLTRWVEQPTATAASLIEAALATARQAQLIGSTAPDRRAESAAPPLLAQIAAVAGSSPDHTAVVEPSSGEAGLSYGALMARVDTWAKALVARGVTAGVQVGVRMDRSRAAVVAVLAVLRAGGCYVPLDAHQPAARQAQILSALNLLLVLTEADVTWLDDGAAALPPSEPVAEAPAYVLFTSGSSGAPKGVEVSHGALRHFVAAAATRYQIKPRDRVLQFAPWHFDTSLEEVFLTLAHGATLVLRSDSMLTSFGAFAAALQTAGITVLDLPTAYWTAWVDALATGICSLPPALRLVILGGEAVHPASLKKWHSAVDADVCLINSYGPTETTIVATTIQLQREHADWAALPIGRPLPGVQLLILDAAGHPRDEGELVILGPTVGSRYLNAPEPLRRPLKVGDQLMASYPTGDRVTRKGDEIVYLGRLDDEVKISGHRVQPNEIEARILRLPGVAEACVLGVLDARGRRRLAAFVAGSRAGSDIRAALRQVLPAPFVPSLVLSMPALPKTRANKIDRAALAASAVTAAVDTALDADMSLVETVKSIWRVELGQADLGDDAHFFRDGGQSLQAIEISLRLTQAFAINVTVADVLQYPALADFCTHLSGLLHDGARAAPLRPVAMGGDPGGGTFCVFPGVGGTSAQFADLAARLGRRAAVKVIEFRPSAFASLAACVAAAAELTMQEGGGRPLTIVGHSFGGCLAFEVARTLEARGVAADLCLLDAYLHLERGDMGVSYQPTGRFSGRCRLIYAQTSRHYAMQDLAAAESRDATLFAGPCEALRTPGDHFSMLAGPNAATLAELMPWI